MNRKESLNDREYSCWKRLSDQLTSKLQDSTFVDLPVTEALTAADLMLSDLVKASKSLSSLQVSERMIIKQCVSLMVAILYKFVSEERYRVDDPHLPIRALKAIFYLQQKYFLTMNTDKDQMQLVEILLEMGTAHEFKDGIRLLSSMCFNQAGIYIKDKQYTEGGIWMTMSVKCLELASQDDIVDADTAVQFIKRFDANAMCQAKIGDLEVGERFRCADHHCDCY
jgi:hypothetical protein